MSFLRFEGQIDPTRGTVLTEEEIKDKRVKEGNCLTCPNRLHEVKRSKFNPFSIKRIPLTTEGKVLKGRCLNCSPTRSEKCAKIKMDFYNKKRQSLIPISHEVPQNNSEGFNEKMENGTDIPFKPTENTSDSQSTLKTDVSDDYEDEENLEKIFEHLSVGMSHSDDELSHISEMIEDMLSDSTSVLVRRKICIELLALTVDDSTKLNVIISGGLIAIQEMMKESHLSDKSLQETACEALNNLMTAATNHHLEGLSTVQNVAGVMMRHPESLAVQQNGVSILWDLSSRNDHFKSSIVQCGGIEITLFSMNMYSSSVRIQSDGCGFLCNMATQPENCSFICEQGGCNIIVDAMKSHQNKESVQHHACSALLNLCMGTGNKDIIENSGALQALIDTMDLNLSLTETKKFAGEALSYLVGSYE